MADLTTRYMGLSLRNPLIAGSSGLTSSIDNIVELEKAGAGAVVLKSLFEEQIAIEANASLKKAENNDLIYTGKSEALDYIDLKIREETLSGYLGLIREAKQRTVIPVIASINCVTSSDWITFATEVEKAGADALELNIAIMHADHEIGSEEVEARYFEIVSKVLSTVKNIPVAVKISPYFTNLAHMVIKLSETGIKGIVMFNRFYSPDIDINTLTEKSTGTLSNPSEAANVLRWMTILAGRTGCDLAASTGIHDGTAMIKQLLAGASAVQVVSSIYRNGIEVISSMTGDLEKYMEKNRYNYIDQLKGKLKRDENSNVAAFERIQFMKYFSEIV
ncbi:MAG: dihydroorotate dehydrogenase-like protein [Bacteroidales bacterium]|nr:dihydroorotate dehydrogenase-like protein [Bacteroidales bacterium]